MKLKFFAVIDTNVLVSAAFSDGYPATILNKVSDGDIVPLFDVRILKEYCEVLSREHFGFSEDKVNGIIDDIVNNGIFVRDVEKTKEVFNDISDIPFFEVKESSADLDSYLVTGNIKDFPMAKTDSYIVTPKEAINIMDRLEKYLELDDNYEKEIYAIVEALDKGDKYVPGFRLVNKINENTREQKNTSLRNKIATFKQDEIKNNISNNDIER